MTENQPESGGAVALGKFRLHGRQQADDPPERKLFLFAAFDTCKSKRPEKQGNCVPDAAAALPKQTVPDRAARVRSGSPCAGRRGPRATLATLGGNRTAEWNKRTTDIDDGDARWVINCGPTMLPGEKRILACAEAPRKPGINVGRIGRAGVDGGKSRATGGPRVTARNLCRPPGVVVGNPMIKTTTMLPMMMTGSLMMMVFIAVFYVTADI
uniref:Uncharacterized protein n=1 Tax=Anopheles atroparvus TaxID=41427 RepID=A0A182JHU0_ANOAO